MKMKSNMRILNNQMVVSNLTSRKYYLEYGDYKTKEVTKKR